MNFLKHRKIKKILLSITLSFIALSTLNASNSKVEAATLVPTELVNNILTNYISSENSSLSYAEASNLSKTVIYYSYQYNVDPLVTASLISAESHFHQSSKSSVGAIGLGQIMPDTAVALGVNPYDATENIEGTCSYLSTQIKNFSNSQYPVEFALAAYNAGPGAVQKYGGIPPYSETQNYVSNIRSKYFSLYNILSSNLNSYTNNQNGYYPSNNINVQNNNTNNENSYNVSYTSYTVPTSTDTGYDVTYDSDDDFSY